MTSQRADQMASHNESGGRETDAGFARSVLWRPMLAVSLKMYLGLRETYDWTRAIVEEVRARNATAYVDIAIFPSYPALEKCRELTLGSGVEVGAQNVFWEDWGPYTGEVSGRLLRELGCAWVEVGHAERRRIFLETDRMAAAKVLAGHRNKLRSVVCVGESSKRDEQGAAQECLVQVRSVLDVLPNSTSIVFAYEPNWAIGVDRPADPTHINSVLGIIRTELRSQAQRLRWIYGGSAGPGLYRRLADHVDGLFLGRRAHDPRTFAKVLDEVLSTVTVTSRLALDSRTAHE